MALKIISENPATREFKILKGMRLIGWTFEIWNHPMYAMSERMPWFPFGPGFTLNVISPTFLMTLAARDWSDIEPFTSDATITINPNDVGTVHKLIALVYED